MTAFFKKRQPPFAYIEQAKEMGENSVCPNCVKREGLCVLRRSRDLAFESCPHFNKAVRALAKVLRKFDT